MSTSPINHISTVQNSALIKSAALLKSKATKTTILAVTIAIVAVIVATLVVCFSQYRAISVENIAEVQSTNIAIWILDFLPFVFAYVGQYSSYMIAHDASMMVMEETKELRSFANQLQLQANFASTHDHLTGLPNRALLYDRINQALKESNEKKESGIAVIVLHIDNLKEIQDTLGSTNTDLIVKQLSTRLESWAKKTHTVARIDSTNFAIALPECNKSLAENYAKNLIKALEPRFIIGTLKLTLHPNLGIALSDSDGEEADMLLQKASVAVVFANKSTSGYSLYSPNMDEHNPRRLTIMGELKKAIESQKLELYFQPKMDVSSKKVVGVEALTRWKHPEYGYISPDEFIGIAERSRLIGSLTEWVLQEAFSMISLLHQNGHTLKISINLSVKDLLNPELPDLIAGLVAKSEVDPSWIIFEITESSIMGDPTRALIIVERLRGMGFEFSIDDFGTGYSSLSYLKKLPVSELKIDKSFVMEMLSNESDAIIVHATIGLAHNLGLSVTAEGVENEEVLNMLGEMNCDLAQGYLFSKALSKQMLLEWLENSSNVS